MTNTIELEIAIKRAGLTKRRLAEMMNLSETGLIRKIKNHSEFKAGEIAQLCHLLNINETEQFTTIFFNQMVDFKSPATRK